MSDSFKSEKRERRTPKVQDNRKRNSHSNMNGNRRGLSTNVANHYTDRQFIEDEWLDDQD